MFHDCVHEPLSENSKQMLLCLEMGIEKGVPMFRTEVNRFYPDLTNFSSQRISVPPNLYYPPCRGVAQAVSHRLPTAAARVRAVVMSCRICVGQSDNGDHILLRSFLRGIVNLCYHILKARNSGFSRITKYVKLWFHTDRLCVPGYWSGGPGSISGAIRFSEK
jgi:hypothetical protein